MKEFTDRDRRSGQACFEPTIPLRLIDDVREALENGLTLPVLLSRIEQIGVSILGDIQRKHGKHAQRGW